MPAFIDLRGQKFGRLTVIARNGKSNQGIIMWLCLCECGKETTVRASDMKNGKTRSCGCLLRETTISRSTIHGHCRRSQESQESQIHKSWAHMISRCTNKTDKNYCSYGGRGIQVCKRWEKFENFLIDMGEIPTKNHSIDRIDNNGNYCKSNCRWATKQQQSRNKRNNHLISYGGKIQCLEAWAEEFSIGSSLLRYRLKNWSIEKALTTPVQERGKTNE